jgi:hypothetical protein
MESTTFKINKNGKNKGSSFTMIYVSPKEAADLIVSLASQLSNENSNSNRLESLISGDLIGQLSIAIDFTSPGEKLLDQMLATYSDPATWKKPCLEAKKTKIKSKKIKKINHK